jgi:glucose-1-phosphate cytidylyltransferase
MMTKVVIFCGGKGTRLREETEYKPKPLVEVGGKPILWHIMKHYSHYGFNDFILCLGYKGDLIKQYFLNYKTEVNDFTISLRDGDVRVHGGTPEDWNITCVDTGLDSLTGKRLRLVKQFIGDDEDIMVTYGDGVSNVDLGALMAFHKSHGSLGTITGIKPVSKFGALRISEENLITHFEEKPYLNDRINGGFLIFKKEIFDHLDDNMLVQTTLPSLAKQKALKMFLHNGFWQCMDTYRDYLHLNKLWQSEKPWKVWADNGDGTDNAQLQSFSEQKEQVNPLQKKKKALIIGASGFLGTLLYNDLQKEYDVVGTYCRHQEPGMLYLDVKDKEQVHRVLDEVKPDIVIHPAAQPWVDFCEENPVESHIINAQGAKHAVDWCAREGAYFLFISTDYIFDGKTGPYVEDAQPGPLNVYGKHKLEVEEYMGATIPNTGCIVRTVGVYGWEKAGKNFVSRLVRTLHEGKEIHVPNDQLATPVHAADLSKAVRSLVRHGKAGVYHAGGPQNLSRYDFSLVIADVFSCNKDLIKGLPTSALGQKANRPKLGGLVSAKIGQELGVEFRGPRSALVTMRDEGNPFE